jgi:hypothetical protein
MNYGPSTQLISRGELPSSNAAKISSSMVPRSSCNPANCANDGIPSPRHRAKTPPKERSIRFPFCTSLVRGSWTGLCNGRPTSSLMQHDRSGQGGCLVRLDHLERYDLQRAMSELCSLDQPNHSLQAYAVSIRGDEQSQRRALLWPPGKTQWHL